MPKRIFPKTPPVSVLWDKPKWGRVLGKYLAMLGLVMACCAHLVAQENIDLTLSETSVLLDQLVLCGDADEQTVVFSISGDNPAPRTNITAFLQLFPGIQLVELNASSSTDGVRLVNDNDPQNPAFSFPDLSPNGDTEITITFSVRTDCAILDTLVNTPDLQIFDIWTIDYILDGSPVSETFTGVEYKDVLSVPNLNLNVAEAADTFKVGDIFTREATISNSGLNSYLSEMRYRVVQEAGLAYQAITINDTPIDWTTTSNTAGDSLVTVNVSGVFFRGNTSGNGSNGNGDNRFDADEVLVIRETILVTNCGRDGNANLATTHQAIWGCDPTENCVTETRSVSVPIGQGEPRVNFQQNPTTSDAGYCETGELSIQVENNGFEFDEGFGTMFDVSAGIGFAVGPDFLSSDQGFEITSLRIAGSAEIIPTDGLISLADNEAFAQDIDGSGGLIDADDDGFFDDLPIGASFDIVAQYAISCTAGNQLDLETGCDNDFRGNFDGKIEYRDVCGVTNEQLFDNFYRSSNTGSTREICTDPDAFNDSDQFTVIYAGERRMTNFNRSCAGNDEIRVSLNLPDGISLTEQTNLQQDTTKYFSTVQTVGQVAVLTFDAAPINLNNNYQFNFVFSTDCSTVGPTSFPVEISYFCPECTCNHIWYCGILEGPVLHAAGPPCADFVCETGLQTTDFSVERTTFGFTDASFTTPFNAEEANKDVALTCDSVEMNLTARVGNIALTDSVGFAINYGNADESESEAPSFLFNFADISIQSGGNTRTCQIDTTAMRVTLTGSNKTMFFDLSGCLNGISLNPGDEINFKGYFAVNPDGPIPTNTFKKIPQFRANGYAIIDGETFDDCDSYGALFRLAKLNTVFSGPNNSSYPSGCAPTNLTYTISKSINANAMRAFFGEEQREAVKVNDIEIDYDPLLLTAYDNLSVEYQIQGSPWLPLPNLATTDNGNYSTGFSLLNTASTITGSNQVFQFRINLTPSCSSSVGSTDSDEQYAIEATVDYQNRSYAETNGNLPCVEQKIDTDSRIVNYQNPPQFTVEGIVNDVRSSESTVVWTMEYCNSSFESDAGLTFVEIAETAGKVSILSIEDISRLDAIDTLNLQTYGADSTVFAFAKGLSRRTTNADPADICSTFRITARLDTCGNNSVEAKVGWNCTPYDNPNWTPELYAPCEQQSIALRASTVDPFLSASFQEAASTISGVLCDTSTMVILVRNEELGNAYDVQSQIILPTGATLVPNSIAFAYPSNAEFVPVGQDPAFLGEDDLGKTYQYDDFAPLNSFLDQNGLLGFNVDQPDSSEFRLQYRFITNCDYQNGELNRYSFQGVSACGATTNNAFAETNPIIFQADPGVARAFNVQFSANSPFIVGDTTTITIEIENSSPNVSVEDKLEIELPDALRYVTSTITASAPNNWAPDEPTVKNDNGIDVLNLLLPSGLAQNERAVLSFEVEAQSIACDSLYTTKIATTSSIEFTCMVDGQSCLYDFSSSDEAIFPLTTNCNPDACNIAVETENSSILMPNCDSTIFYCFNQYTPEALENYTITDNGEIIDSNRFEICNFQQVCIYTYAQINNIGGDISVDSWTVDGITYSGIVGSIQELVDSMNVWDEDGNWIVLPEVLIIQGGHVGGDYSRMELSFPDKGIRSSLGYDTRLTPRGISVLLDEGLHQLIVTNEAGCKDTLNVDVIRQECPDCRPPIVQTTVIENANCGEENGRVTINLDKPASEYEFNWSPNVGEPNATGNVRSGLPTASYFVQIIDRSNRACFETILVNVGNADAPLATFTSTNPDCGAPNGSVALSPDSLTYNWSDGFSGAERNDLLEGRYIITVADPNNPNCTNLITLGLEGENRLMVEHTIFQRPNCLNNNGIMALDVTGGSGEYASSFPNGQLVQTNLYGGTYNINVIDLNTGCTVPYLLNLDNEIHTGAIEITATQDISCTGENIGAVEFEIDFQNGFRFPADTVISNGSETFENGQLPAGNYQIILEDGNGCVAGSETFSIENVEPLQLNISTQGKCDEPQSIFLDVTGGHPFYVFDWADLAGIQNIRDRQGLESGTYDLTVFDTSNCGIMVPIVLDSCDCTPPTVLSDDVQTASCGQSDGSITVNLEEDINLFNFNWSTDTGNSGATPNRRTNLAGGDYTVTISNSNNASCQTVYSFTIPTLDTIENPLSETIIQNALCGQATGQVDFVFQEDSEAFNIDWFPNLGTIGTTPNSRINLPGGDYTVTISSVSNPSCQTVVPINIPALDTIGNPLADTIIQSALCGQATGQVDFSFTDVTQNFTINWTPNLGNIGFSPNSRVNLPAGDYTVTFVDVAEADCSYSVEITVPESAPAAEATVFPSNCLLPPTGTAVLMPTNYTFTWPDGTVSSSRNRLPPGIYNVSFSDSNSPNCTGTIQVIIEATNVLSAEATILQQPSCGEANGAASINVTGGSDNYTYSWNSADSIAENLAAGDYSVTIFDADQGCQTITEFTLNASETGTATIFIVETLDENCVGNNDGGIEFAVDYSDNFNFPADTVITNGVDTFSNNQLSAGEYCLEIFDSAGCFINQSCFTIEEATPFELDYEVAAACADTGGIRLNIMGGALPYSVDWLDLEGTDDPISRIGLDTGNYEVIVTDANGCVETTVVRVPECDACLPPTITDISVVPASCTGNTGSIFIQMEENERDYEYVYTPDLGEPFVTENIRTSLPKGIYKILIIYKPNPTCLTEIEVEVPEKNFDDLLPITSSAGCGLSNGRARLFPDSYRYTWADGFVGNERDDLAAGFYQIQVRDEEFDCNTLLTITVEEENLLQAKISINQAPTCGNNDGSVTININGGSGDYSYSWDEVGDTKDNLSSGTYALLIRDNRTGCQRPITFTLIDFPITVVDITLNDTENPSCPLEADGSVDFTTNLENVVSRDLDTIISNGHSLFQNGQLPEGNYCISVVDTMGCVFGQACFSIDAPEFLEVEFDIIPQCEEGGQIEVLVDGGLAPYTFDWADVDGFADQAMRTGLPVGFYDLTVTDANGCASIFDSLEIASCIPCPLLVGRDTLQFNLTDCAATSDICLDYDFDARNPYTVNVDGVNLDLFALNSCSMDTIRTYTVGTLFGQGRLGTYNVTSWPVNDSVFTGDFSTLAELVEAMNEFDTLGNWQYSADSTQITGGAPGSSYGQIDATLAGTPIESFLELNTTILQRGIDVNLTRGVHEVTIQDPRTFCEDTLIVLVTCVKMDTLAISINVNQQQTICLSTEELVGNLTTNQTDCNGANIDVTIANDTCVVLTGIAVGKDTACVVLCDEFGVCDTTILTINVTYDMIEDTLMVDNSNTFCLDTIGLKLEGTVNSMEEICQTDTTQQSVNYEFDVADKCITYTANTIGKDTACVKICDDLGLCDTLEFVLTVRNNPPDEIVDTIFIGELEEYCFDSLIFPGDITFFENVCPDSSGSSVDFFLDPINFCVEYSGVDIGRETACVVICDANNICDTASFEVVVIEFLELPTAVDDVDTTDKGVPIVLNLKENDIPFGVGDDGFQILEPPLFGEAFINLDGSTTYIQDKFCERNDQFSYTLCNDIGCDTAVVTIYIRCVDIEVFTAMSPNRDGINDVFFISRIEEFPDSELRIFNRWGNLVFQTTNYQNDWTGTWKNDQELPDGTYFYQLDLNDPNDNRQFEGFFELHR
ncbi:MAG: gliding motility-associated C-terminal domain-containing protein [Bacteroidota bacterium]